ncbi:MULTISPECIES: hypothetical protein [unclassified Oceanobacillus]|uniref:hypothetical protein n=1 Tax=unclassified Oceanobacillus TaxID=2630292 RepID=UPI00300E6CA9
MDIKRVLLQDFIYDICILIDNGFDIEIEEINFLIESKKIKNYFKNKYSFEVVGVPLQGYQFSDEDWGILQDLLEEVHNAYGNKRFGIIKRGLPYLIVLANTNLRSLLTKDY